MTWTSDLASPDFIQLDRDGGALRITLNRPDRLNAMDAAMTRSLWQVLRDAAADDTVRAVLLTGAGRAFSAGADIGATFATDEDRKLIERDMREVTAPLVMTIREMPKPVVVAVNGAVAGFAVGVALAGDQLLAAESAYFLLAFANLGLTVDGGTSLLVAARVGFGRATQMAMLADKVPAGDALSWGLVDRVVPAGALADAAEALVLRLAAGPTQAYAATKRLINESQLAGLSTMLQREATEQGRLVFSDDFTAAVEAFARKEKPTFTGN